jgi:hypothetical protein
VFARTHTADAEARAASDAETTGAAVTRQY